MSGSPRACARRACRWSCSPGHRPWRLRRRRGGHPRPRAGRVLEGPQGRRGERRRTQTLLRRADIVVVRFGDKYRQWNAAFEAGYGAALGEPLITLHDPELTHALKEVDRPRWPRPRLPSRSSRSSAMRSLAPAFAPDALAALLLPEELHGDDRRPVVLERVADLHRGRRPALTDRRPRLRRGERVRRRSIGSLPEYQVSIGSSEG